MLCEKCNKKITHNHITRDIKHYGDGCHCCDMIHLKNLIITDVENGDFMIEQARRISTLEADLKAANLGNRRLDKAALRRGAELKAAKEQIDRMKCCQICKKHVECDDYEPDSLCESWQEKREG